MQKVVDVEDVWVQVKHYLFKEFWMKKYTECIRELPRWRSMRQIIYISVNETLRFRKEAEKMPPLYKLPPATKYSILFDDDEDYSFCAADQCAILPYLPVANRNQSAFSWPEG